MVKNQGKLEFIGLLYNKALSFSVVLYFLYQCTLNEIIKNKDYN